MAGVALKKNTATREAMANRGRGGSLAGTRKAFDEYYARTGHRRSIRDIDEAVRGCFFTLMVSMTHVGETPVFAEAISAARYWIVGVEVAICGSLTVLASPASKLGSSVAKA
jgi:hypothetical protein